MKTLIFSIIALLAISLPAQHVDGPWNPSVNGLYATAWNGNAVGDPIDETLNTFVPILYGWAEEFNCGYRVEFVATWTGTQSTWIIFDFGGTVTPYTLPGVIGNCLLPTTATPILVNNTGAHPTHFASVYYTTTIPNSAAGYTYYTQTVHLAGGLYPTMGLYAMKNGPPSL
tara:strand:+ start:483 stop:995 length:513 start_codon:yes stop_codon:yes gene_type:complete